MPILRNGETPAYFRYGTKYVIVKNDEEIQELPDSFNELEAVFITIPPYQRKLVWKLNDVEKLIKSESQLFGTAILAQLQGKESWILMDGLQRFAVITAFLFHLFPEVISAEENNTAASTFFTLLRSDARGYNSIIKHNHFKLLEHGRVGIKKSYQELSDIIKNYVTEGLGSNHFEQFCKSVSKALSKKQIAIDPYTGFNDNDEINDTFFNINSTGIQLSYVDLLRSKIIGKGFSNNWDPEEIDDVENELTEFCHPTL